MLCLSVVSRVCLVLLILLVTPLTSGFAQSSGSVSRAEQNPSGYPIPNQFEHLSVKDGLSTNSVRRILQDREGYMWFGTSDGLNKYDGQTFTVFQQDPNNPTTSLRSNAISDLYEDTSGRLWVTTSNDVYTGGGGLHQVNKQTGTATLVNIKVPSPKWKQTLGISQDRQGTLWIGSGAGLIRYVPKTEAYTLYPSPRPDTAVICSLEDAQNRFWVGTLKGLYQFDRQSGGFTLVPLKSAPANSQPWVSTLYQDKAGRIWAGTNRHGLLQIDGTGKAPELISYAGNKPVNRHIFSDAIHEGQDGQLWLGTTEGLQQVDTRTHQVRTYRTTPALPSGLKSDSVQAVYYDRNGTLWLGTHLGINKQAPASAMFTTVQLVPAPPSVRHAENNISALLQDHTGMIWIGSENQRLYRYNPTTGQKTLIPLDLTNPLNPAEEHHVQAIYEDRSRQLWVSTVSALLRMNRLTGRFVRYPTRIRQIQAIAEDTAGFLWLGGNGGIAQFNPKNGQVRYYRPTPDDTADGSCFVNCLLVSRTGDIWVTSTGKGICRLQPNTGKLIRYNPNPSAPIGQLNDNAVTALFEDSDGVVWMGTSKGGLNRFNPVTGRFSVLTTRQGLPANHVSSIISDRHGHLWISTTRGICRFNPKTETFHIYTTDDGLPYNEFMSKVAYGLNGDLLFGSLNGVAIVHPDRIYKGTTFPVFITRLGVFDQNRPLTGDRAELSHDENFISFDFVALTYVAPEKNQYAYQLVGVDKQWVYSGTRHFASYPDLAPGTYTFRVKAANRDGIWNERGATVQVIILPPWWATWWAYGLYALLAGVAIRGFFQFYTNRIKQRQELALNRREAEQLKAVDELKTRFFSNITHEFRTPLSLIISPVEKLLEKSQFDRPTLTLVHRNAEKLLRLINQLLDLSKLEGNYMAVSLVQGNLTDFLHHIVEVFGRAAEQKGITLTWTADQLPPHTQVFDADKWEKILTNLLSNALKFTPAGGQVTLTVSPVWAAGKMTGVQMEVADSGIGIAPDQLPHIFDRFYQADTSTTRAYEGTGIGLALVYELIGLLGGTITVTSQLNVGTTFRLTLPVEAVPTHAETPLPDWSARKPSFVASSGTPRPVSSQVDDQDHRPQILIVEDNDELREFLVGELAGSYQILEAVDGQAGWEVVQTELPDIVLTDVMMPRMDGTALTQLIKGHAETDHIAVVMLTAKTAQQSRLDGLQHGADDYLSKPFSVDELHLRLHNLITRQQKLADHYRQRLPYPPTAPPPRQNDPRPIPTHFFSGFMTSWMTTWPTRRSMLIGWLSSCR